VAHGLAGYQPRAAEHGVLYRVIDEHLETFLDAAAHHAGGHRLPNFVEQEFRAFLTCGVLAHASRGRHPAACSGTAMGAESAPSAPLSRRVGPQAVPRRAGRLRARPVVVPAPPRPPPGLRNGHSGCVTVIQRFGGGLNLNVHFHTLVLDGVFTNGEGDTLRPPVTLEPTTLATEV
jgi:hypothetical protein